MYPVILCCLIFCFFFLWIRRPLRSTLFPYTTLFRSSIFYTTPTAIRLLMRYGEEWPKKYDLSTLRVLGSVGEPINPERSEEHTSELQSLRHLVCRLLLEKKKWPIVVRRVPPVLSLCA